MECIEKTIGEMSCDQLYLPVGWRDAEGQIRRFCTIKELDGEVEEAILDSKLKDNVGKIITELLFGVVETMEGTNKVTKDMIRNLSTVDRDFLILMLHKKSSSSIVNFSANCSYCNKLNDITYDIDDLNVRIMPEDHDFDFSFELPSPVKDKAGNTHSDITIILPNGWMQEKVSPFGKTNPAQANTALLQSMTKKLGSLEMPINIEIFRKMSSRSRKFISKYIEELNLGAELAIKETCAYCGEEFTTIIPLTALVGE